MTHTSCKAPEEDHGGDGRLRQGYCEKHYRRWKSSGSTASPRLSPHSRFMRSIVKELGTNCWIWQNYLDSDGYGQFKLNGKYVRVHRWSYEFHKGPIPAGKEIDHKCRNRACVNPRHLRAVTHRQNLLAAPRWQKKLKCPKGHPLVGRNLMIQQGRRRCRECNLIAQRAWYARQKRIEAGPQAL